MDDHPGPSPEPRQRWRLVVARTPDAPPLAQREFADAWLAAIEAAGLPVARSEGATARPRLSFGAPLPVGMAADGELIDVVITERWPAWRVREALEPRLPDGWRLVRLEDVWLGGPPLAGRVAAADYRITLALGAGSFDDASPAPVGAKGLDAACVRMLAAKVLPRERAKGDRVVTYDLRPLLIHVAVRDPGPPPVLIARTRFHPELGTGRPEEVVAALANLVGAPLEVASVVRVRLLLADDLERA